jgi:hypothetical protein
MICKVVFMSKEDKKWSARVTAKSRALNLEDGVFTWKSPRRIALSLKRSARVSKHPFLSAMSMLNFYINRAGTNLSKERLLVLNRAKIELRKLFGKL